MLVIGRNRPRPEPPGAEEDEQSVPLSRTVRRQRIALVAAVVSALVSAGGLAAATLVKSPAERAAQTAPPPYSLLTAPVVSRVLSPSVTARAAVYPPTRYEVVPAPASAEVTQLYLSKVNVKPGDQVTAGQLLAEVSGQPLYVFKGAVPAYRDLKPGSSGPDVTELQEALAEAGHPVGTDRKGTFGPGTGRAVTDFYRDLGYPVPVTGAATQQAVDTARKAVDAARQSVDSLAAQKNGQQPGTGQGPAAGSDLDSRLAAARSQLTSEKDTLARAEAVNGPMVPAAHVVFLPTLPATVTAVNSSVGLPVSGTLLSITSGGLTVTGQLTAAQAAAVKPGMAVEILEEDTGKKYDAKVEDLGRPTTAAPAGKVVPIGGTPAGQNPAVGQNNPAPGAPNAAGGTGASYIPVGIVADSPLPAALNGKNVRVTIRKAVTDEPVTAVPVAAISTDATGRTSVTVVGGGGLRTTVPVTTGITADGLVGVTPVDGGTLRPGDQVVVGR